MFIRASLQSANVLVLPVCMYALQCLCQNTEEKGCQPTHLLSLSSLCLRVLSSVCQTAEPFDKINISNADDSFGDISQPIQEFKCLRFLKPGRETKGRRTDSVLSTLLQ